MNGISNIQVDTNFLREMDKIKGFQHSSVTNQSESAIKARGQYSKQEKEKLRTACQDFVSLFINQMYKSMNKTLNPENSLFYGGFAEEVFNDMLTEKYAQMTAKKEQFGLVDQVYKSLMGTPPERHDLGLV